MMPSVPTLLGKLVSQIYMYCSENVTISWLQLIRAHFFVSPKQPKNVVALSLKGILREVVITVPPTSIFWAEYAIILVENVN